MIDKGVRPTRTKNNSFNAWLALGTAVGLGLAATVDLAWGIGTGLAVALALATRR